MLIGSTGACDSPIEMDSTQLPGTFCLAVFSIRFLLNKDALI